MAVQFYSSLDAGAPVLSGDMFARTRQILLACLVSGYGAKPAAGWAVGHDVTDGFSLGNGDGIINFRRYSTAGYDAYIMEAITDGSTALAGGINRRSAGWYDGSSVSEQQRFYGSTGSLTGTTPFWSVIADDKTCIFQWGGGTTIDPSGNTYPGVHYFGRYINTLGLEGVSAFCSLGGNNAGGINYIGNPSFRFGTCLRNPFTGLVDQGVSARYGACPAVHNTGYTYVLSNTKLLPSRLIPVRAALYCVGNGVNGNTSVPSLAGYLRGMISEPTLSGVLAEQMFGLLGVEKIATSKARLITVPGGGQWLPLFPHTTDSAFFVSMDSADWG